MLRIKYGVRLEEFEKMGFVEINGFLFRDRNLIITKNGYIKGVGIGLTDEEYDNPIEAEDLIQAGLVEKV